MMANDATLADPASEAAPLTPRRLTVGSRFAGRYEIETLLGEGGMGAVYRVRDSALAESVALKVLTLPTSRTREYADMFRQEVKLSRRITHANVVHVYDIGEVDSLLYMTMELVDGITLRKALNDAPAKRLPLNEAIRVGHSLANGLAAVHAQGIVHRDLKPGNVMLGKSGRVVLADFGIASHVDTDHPAMRGRLLGTISYMAPEQFAKQPPSPRTDLYSFGLVLLECLSGALPPRCDGWLSSHRKEIQVNLAGAGVAGQASNIAAVESLLRKCLANDPGARPASAEDVSRVLNALLQHEQSAVDIRLHSVQRVDTSVAVGPRMPSSSAEAPADRTTIEVAEIVAHGIPDDVAHDYVTARHEARLNEATHLVSAFERMESCVQRVPQFLQAIAGRAILAVRCWFFDRTATSGVDWEPIATEAVDAALLQAPELSDSHLAMGMLATQRFEMKRATRALTRAIEINPSSHEAQEYLGQIEIETGLVSRGMPRLTYAASAIPHRPMPSLIMARCLALLGRFDEANVHLAEAMRRSTIPTLGGVVYGIRIHAYRWGKRPYQLSISQRKVMRQNNWLGAMHYLDALEEKSDPAVVNAWIDSLEGQMTNPRAEMVLMQVVIEVCMLVGLEARALKLLAACARKSLIDILWVDRCPLLAPLRTMDGYGEIRDWVWLNAYGVWN